MMDVLGTGRVAVVTGAASGIGLALATAFVELDMAVVMADVEQDAVAAAADRLSTTGARVLPIQTDVRMADQLQQLFDATMAEFGRADVLCNNAGVSTRFVPTWELELSDWRWMIDVNLWGVINGVHTFLPHMIERGSGHIVNTASMAGLTVIANNSAYNVAKHGVVSLTETLRAELDEQGKGIGATVLCPSLVRTRIMESERNRPAELAASTPAADPGPLPGGTAKFIEPPEVAAMVLAAIRTNRLYLSTHAGSRARVEPRCERILAELD